MNIYAIDDFINEFNSLRRKKHYAGLEKDIIDYFIGKSIDDVKSGTRLNNSDTTPFIKKRLDGSGGYRVYYLLIIKNDNLYLMFVHPKTGPDGSENITDEFKKQIYKKILESIQKNKLYSVSCDEERESLVFTKVPVVVATKK